MSKFCSKCGKENGDNACFCVACGNPLEGNPANASKPAPDAPKAPSKLMMEAKRSYIGHYGFFMTILYGILCLAIVGIFILLFTILTNKTYVYHIYNDRIVSEGGFFNKTKHTRYFSNVLSVSKEQGFRGQIFNFGNVYVNMTGKEDLSFYEIKNPDAVVNFFEKMIHRSSSLNQVVID